MQAPKKVPTVYTLQETADQLKVSIRTVKRLVESGKIQHTKVSDRLRFTEQHLNNYLEANEVKVFDPSKVRL